MPVLSDADVVRRRPVTTEELRDWREHGAIWRPVELDDEHVVIDLCTCSGEPMERVRSKDPKLIAYVRTHREN